jgi:hypothetical protein
MMSRRVPLWLMTFCATVALTPSALADPVAESLFQEGVALMKARKLDEACPKLEASFAREALSGTLMTVAQCHDLQGKTATAWKEYKRAAALAKDEGRAKYEARAKELADDLDKRLTRLQLKVSGAAPDQTITLNGETVPVPSYGTAVPIDPGHYTVEASAPGHESWSQGVTLEGEGKLFTMPIPALKPLAPEPGVAEPAPVVAPTPTAPATPTTTPAPPPPDDGPDQADSGGVPAWAWVAGGLGIASAAVSAAGLGIQLSAASRLDDECGADRQDCPAGYDFEGDHGTEKLGNGLFIGFGVAAIVGLGIGTTGIILGATGEDSEAALQWELVPVASSQTGGALVQGRF